MEAGEDSGTAESMETDGTSEGGSLWICMKYKNGANESNEMIQGGISNNNKGELERYVA